MERKADFIFVDNFSSQLVDVTKEELRRLGYDYLGQTMGEQREMCVYTKKEYHLKLHHYNINTIDLLLKKNLFCLK